MELSDIQKFALASSYSELVKAIKGSKKNSDSVLKYLKQYEPETHDIMDEAKRPNKLIETDASPKIVEVTRLPISVQKLIVAFAAAFLCGNPIQLNAAPADKAQQDLMAVLRKSWSSNKLDYDSKNIAKLMMSETEVAEIWYAEQADAFYWANTPNEGKKIRLRMKIVAKSKGDDLYPVFNSTGDMIAFARAYFVKVNSKDVEHFDVYTDQINYFGVNSNAGWEMKDEKNLFQKIPVIYYSQPKAEWSDVQWLIDRFEKTLSNHSDTNDYFGSPMVKVSGKIKGFSTKGESGKVLEMENGAKAEYMSWDQSPKSMELEFKNLRSLIYDLTSTPDISIEQMKSLGTYSGIALKMLFLAPHLKASDKEENFGKSIQRRINFMKHAMSVMNQDSVFQKATGLEIVPKFEYFLPKDEAAIIDMLMTATGNKPIMTVATAVRQSPLVIDKEAEIAKLNEQMSVEEIENP